MLAEVESLVRRSETEAALDQVIAETVAVIEAMAGSGLVEVGDVREQTGFLSWNIPAADAATRIRSEWQGLGRNLGMDEICWLSNTTTGDERAERFSNL